MRSKALLVRLIAVALLGALNVACGPNEAEEIRRRAEAENFNRLENENMARQIARSQNRARLSSSEFTQPPQRVQLTDQPYIRGKLLALTRREPASFVMDSAVSIYGNASGLLTETPEEVGTVALLDCKKQRAGTFVIESQRRSVPGFIWLCELTLVDRSIAAVIHRRTFRGEEAGYSVTGERRTQISSDATEVVGEMPSREVGTFLSSLPRR